MKVKLHLPLPGGASTQVCLSCCAGPTVINGYYAFVKWVEKEGRGGGVYTLYSTHLTPTPTIIFTSHFIFIRFHSILLQSEIKSGDC